METGVKQAIIAAAKLNGIDPAGLLAVKTVETGEKSGFLDDGRPQILFEGHIFYKYYNINHPTANKSYIQRAYPSIYYPKWSKKFYQNGTGEHERLEIACKLDREAGLMSASWGIGQIMGFNYKSCGCDDIQEFVNMMYLNLDSQLILWCTYLKKTGLITLINNHDWGSFTKKYNGSGQVEYYSKKLAKAYIEYEKSI